MRKLLLTKIPGLRGKVIICLLMTALLGYPARVISANGDAKQDGKQITGTVTDAQSEEPLPGVSIQIKGTTTGTITDLEGKYSIQVNTGETLIFSYVGYTKQEVMVGDQTTIDVLLEEDVVGLDDVVVIGYGVQKKKLNTGANLNISGEDIEELRTTTAMDALQGVSPGVSITRNSGQPGSGTKVNIRGIGTTGNYGPLYIVDGVAVGNIDYLNPSDIESIDILKDAASAAIYGSRAANGVVLVTTKSGEKGKTTVSYDTYVGVQNIYNRPDLLNAQQYAEVMNEGWTNLGQDPWDFESMVPDWDRIESGEWNGTNWFDEIENENAMVQNHSLSITGGTEKSTYSMGASYLEEDGILGEQVNNDYKRLNLRLNSEHVLFENEGRNIITVGQNLTYSNTKDPAVRTGNIYWNDLRNMLVASPFLPVHDSTGGYHYAIDWNTQESNPIAVMELQAKDNYNKNNTIVGNAYLEVQPVRNLTLRSSYGVNHWYGSSRHWIPEYDLSTINSMDRDQVNQGMYSGFTWTFTNTATYSFDLLNNHHFSAVVGTEAIKTAQDLNIDGHNENSIFQDPEFAYLDNVNAVDATYTTLSGRDEYGGALLSYFGRVSYDYRETYLFTAIARYDASTNFGANNRWSFFPSLSAGWIISNENFMQGTSDWLNHLKLRLNWGQNGNENIQPFAYSSTISFDQANYFFGTDKSIRHLGSYPARVPNPSLRWETSEQMGVGVDMNFMSNQLQVSFDWYNKTTGDWLVQPNSPATDGTNAPWRNGGSVSNNGIETMIRWKERSGSFKYGISGSMAYNQNEVIQIPNAEGVIPGPANVLSQGTNQMFRAEEGYPIGYFWGYKTDGIIQNEQEAENYVNADGEPYFPDVQPGDVRFVDANNDGVIDSDDKVMIGDPNPDVIVGLQLDFEFKGIYLNMKGNGQFGNQIAKSYRSADSPRNNYTTDILDSWDGEGSTNEMPRLIYGAHRNTQLISDLYIEDGDYFRISNITLGYNIDRLFDNFPFQRTRLYVSGRNLFTFTNYSGMDPEVGYAPEDDNDIQNDYSWASGIDLGLYPLSRVYMLGLSVNF